MFVKTVHHFWLSSCGMFSAIKVNTVCVCVCYRLDPLFGACAGQFGHTSYLHSQVSSADHGLSGQRLLLQTAGELSLSEQSSTFSLSSVPPHGIDSGRMDALLFRSTVNLHTSGSQQRMCLIMLLLFFVLFSSAVSPSRSWVQRTSTTCWWPLALIRSWRLSERSFTTACWRPEMWTVSSPQVQSSASPLPHRQIV